MASVAMLLCAGISSCGKDDDLDSPASTPTPPMGVEAVNLGLPSGILWANMNIGATSREDYGDYFAWGETKPKKRYDWSNYKWCKGTSDALTKYFSDFDNQYPSLDPEDDAATANWGGTWRMPTLTEFGELCQKCKWTWTSSEGVDGYKVTGPNGNYIFLPASGDFKESEVDGDGIWGEYWSSTLYYGNEQSAWYYTFYKGEIDRDADPRYHGKTIRAVCPW